MKFEWDDAKARSNLHSHKSVSFELATTVFRDPLAIELLDDRYDYGEDRFILIGRAQDQRILFVAHTERGDAIRIISAREATSYEEKHYLDEASGAIPTIDS